MIPGADIGDFLAGQIGDVENVDRALAEGRNMRGIDVEVQGPMARVRS
jgi:hypothetical protein